MAYNLLIFIPSLLLALWLLLSHVDTFQAVTADSDRPRTLAFHLDRDHSSYPQSDGDIQFVVQQRPNLDSYPTPTLLTRPTSVYRPRSIHAFMDSRFSSEDVAVEWDEVEVEGPDIEDRHTLQQLAMMSGNAYALPGQKSWYGA